MPDPYPNPYPNSVSVPFANGGAAAAAAKRPKQPPLYVPAGHVAFRLLCHASRIGGVIGKSGVVIKQLQQSTGAKIRVEDAPPECSDRVIAVIAPAALCSRVTLRESDKGENNAVPSSHVENESDKKENTEDYECRETEISKAQEALLRVFERILEVAAESNGVEVGVGVVSCRLLVETNRVGSIIGKQGKVVESIRKETGTKVRVLVDKLPACANRNDEMLEIEGDVLGVKRALLAVTHRLQDCPPTDKTKIIGRPAEVIPNRTLPDVHVHSHPQQNVALPSMRRSSTSYIPGVRPLSMVTNRMPLPDTKIPLQEMSFRILCSNDRIGAVIGKGGTIVKALESETGTNIIVGPIIAGCEERLVTITASENPESRYSPAQKALALVFARSVETGFQKGLDSSSSKPHVTACLVVQSNQAGCLLGKGGAIVSDMRRATSTNIWLIGGNQVPNCALENDEIVQISGEISNVQNAVFLVTSRLRDNLLSNTVNIAGTRNSAIPVDSFGRSRDDAAAVPSSVGVSHGPSQYPTLSQKFDRLGISHSADNPPPPMMAVNVNSTGHTDVSKGLTPFKGGMEIGSGSRTAFVANTTIEIVVPENVIDSVYGENGSNLERLRQISGAKVVVHEPRPGTSDRMIVISGTPDEVQAAQSLLQAFILTGS